MGPSHWNHGPTPCTSKGERSMPRLMCYVITRTPWCWLAIPRVTTSFMSLAFFFLSHWFMTMRDWLASPWPWDTCTSWFSNQSCGDNWLGGNLPENSKYVHIMFSIFTKMKTHNLKFLINNLMNSENEFFNCGLREGMSESVAVFSLLLIHAS